MARPFQLDDRVLVTRYDRTYSGVIERLGGTFAFIRRDDDPELSRMLEVVSLLEDLTAGENRALGLVELWDGGINGAWTGVDEYRCSEPGCDYHVLAVGTPDPDEPDYYSEGIDEHERGHAESDAPAIELVTPPSMTPEARQLLTDQFAALAATGSVAHAPSPQDGVVSLWFSDPASAIAPPVQMVPDQADAGHRVIAAALAFDELDDRREGLDVAGVDAWDTAREGLRQALAGYRKATNR